MKFCAAGTERAAATAAVANAGGGIRRRWPVRDCGTFGGGLKKETNLVPAAGK